MKTQLTPLASKIFASIQAKNPYAVFLANKEEGPRLTFGPNSTTNISYDIHLDTDRDSITLSSDSPQTFALLLDRCGPENTPRLVLYQDKYQLPVIEYCEDTSDRDVVQGYILIQAHEEYGHQTAVIHAVLNPMGNSSLLVDGSEILLQHLVQCSELMKVLKGGTYDVIESAWDSEMDNASDFDWTTAME